MLTQIPLMRSVWHGCLSVALLAPLPAIGSSVALFEAEGGRGPPVSQTFLGADAGNVSLLRTEGGVSCVASRGLPIAEASYSAPDGAPVPFDEVTRSPAASIQAIARAGGPVDLRVQLKYAADPARPIGMRVAGRTVDLSDTLEPSGDSLLLTGARSRLLAREFRRGAAARLFATSDATGRRVADHVLAPDMAGLDRCLTRLDAMPAGANVPILDLADFDVVVADIPGAGMWGRTADRRAAGASGAAVTAIRVAFTARPDPELLVDPSTLTHCRMRDIPDEVFAGRLTSVTGFFSQTRDVYVAFDEQGAPERAYIPGIFDSDLGAGARTVRISIAADSNLPDRPNTVKGCLGDAPLPAPLCLFPGPQDGQHRLAACADPGTPRTREDHLARIDDPLFGGPGDPPPITRVTGDSRNGGRSFVPPVGPGPPRNAGGSFGGSSGGSFGGGGGGGISGTDEPDSLLLVERSIEPVADTGEVPAIPLPAALWTMLLALAGVSGPLALTKLRQTP